MAELISEPIAPRSGTFDTAPMGRGEPGLPYIAHEENAERAYREGVFRACWAEGRDIADREVLGDCARDAGLSRDNFLKRLDHEQYRNAVLARAVAGLEDRVFGVPFFVVDGKRFWGNDRIEFLLDALSGKG